MKKKEKCPYCGNYYRPEIQIEGFCFSCIWAYEAITAIRAMIASDFHLAENSRRYWSKALGRLLKHKPKN